MNAKDDLAPRILIAEGDPSVRDMLRQMLLSIRGDAHLEICEDGAQALAAFSTDPDVIIAGRELAGISGLDLLRNVRGNSDKPQLPFILMSEHVDVASVREALPYSPTAYLGKPLNLDSLRIRLEGLLLEVGRQIGCSTPAVQPGVSLSAFLDQRRASTDGGPLFADVSRLVLNTSDAQELDLGRLEQQLCQDPQLTAVLIAAANSAEAHCDGSVQTLPQALNRLGSAQSLSLIMGLELKRSARLSDPLLARHAEHFLNLSLQVAEFAHTLAGMLNVDQARCYYAGLLHCLGDLAVIRSLQQWRTLGGELDDDMVQVSLNRYGAPFGSALRARWRLPFRLRGLVAAIYHLWGGVYARDCLVMNLAGQLAYASPTQSNATIAGSTAARLLKVDLPTLDMLREPSAVPIQKRTGVARKESPASHPAAAMCGPWADSRVRQARTA
ncbi:HDOD domain-containing protein [Pseudomonas sp. RW3S2]|uniref:HDOD domain-containing protein n=1 Tax=Pseudomonas sp. RW3S2 TaxID=485884 RepID=UPI0016467613|nr:HDOD domain-containing protein [Pseudomonas sp. RW3S2]MBC3420091.1 HDOD domain-containing protein [Pseudomonas sp. RW3S2]